MPKILMKKIATSTNYLLYIENGTRETYFCLWIEQFVAGEHLVIV